MPRRKPFISDVYKAHLKDPKGYENVYRPVTEEDTKKEKNRKKNSAPKGQGK